LGERGAEQKATRTGGKKGLKLSLKVKVAAARHGGPKIPGKGRRQKTGNRELACWALGINNMEKGGGKIGKRGRKMGFWTGTKQLYVQELEGGWGKRAIS